MHLLIFIIDYHLQQILNQHVLIRLTCVIPSGMLQLDHDLFKKKKKIMPVYY